MEISIKQNNIPTLRFPGFLGEWTDKELGNLVGNIGGTALEVFASEKGSHKFISIGNYSIDGKYIDNGQKIVLNDKTKTKLLNKGDLAMVLNDKTASGDLIGSTILINEDNKFIYNQRTERLICDDDFDSHFAWHILNSIKFRKRIVKISQGGTQIYVNFPSVKKEKISLPDKKEQQKIAEFLGSTDEWIENLRAQKKSFELYKKGMMQKIFSQEIRFKDNNGKNFPEWEEKKLGDICDYKNGGAFENNLVENGKYNLITLNSIDISGKLKKNHKTVGHAEWYLKKRDLIMVLSDVAHGNFLGLTDIIPEDNKYVLNQRMGLLRKKDDEVDLNFLRTYINKQQKYFKLHGQGSSQQNLSKGDILKFKIPMPQLLEQQTIAEFLTSIDNLIESKQQQIVQAEQWKKGLMQGLFV